VILGQTEHAVGVIPAQVGLHERRGDVIGVFRCRAHALECAGNEVPKGTGGQGLHGIVSSHGQRPTKKNADYSEFRTGGNCEGFLKSV
jgi:hypothetical protein